MIIETLQILAGTLFVMFLPGYFFSLLTLKRLKTVERVSISFALSIVIVVFVAFTLTLSYMIFGIGINPVTVWVADQSFS